MGNDPYVDPETNILRNVPGIRDAELLDTYEAHATSWRLEQLEDHGPLGSFDADHLKAIHQHVFQDVYPWAGEFRTVEILVPNGYFGFTRNIDGSLDRTFRELKTERNLSRLSTQDFAGRAAHYLGELNAIHAFRDGNGRTQREFIRQLATNAGYRLRWDGITREQMYEASRTSFQKGDNRELAGLLARGLDQPENAFRNRSQRKRERDREDDLER